MHIFMHGSSHDGIARSSCWEGMSHRLEMERSMQRGARGEQREAATMELLAATESNSSASIAQPLLMVAHPCFVGQRKGCWDGR
jgi:hypothetical protein